MTLLLSKHAGGDTSFQCLTFAAHELDLVEQRPLFEEIAAVPSSHDVAVALARVKNRKAPGS